MSMMQTFRRRIGARALASLPALLGVIVFTFILMRVLPGDPAVYFASGPNAGQAEIDGLRHKMGLDRPMPIQLAHYVAGIVTGDLGNSLTTGQPVMHDIRARLPASLELTLTALGLSLLLSLPLGIVSAWYANSRWDQCIRTLCTICFCIPPFVSAIFLIYVFYYIFGLVPDPTGRINIFTPLPHDITGFLLVDFLLTGDPAGWREAAGQLLLPAVTMALFVLSPLTRMTRASLLTVMNSDFIRTARAMGLPTWRIVTVYALRNALSPILTTVGIVFSTMLGANVLVEKVFSWPGVASYALDALVASDYAPVQGFILLMAILFIMVNLLVDILQGLVDPRVSME
ncbi:ABC transporter permease [Gluconacetobacter azotocaptans]|uniref:ABC transporter permease n=2 Tax=Gluconacetobacter azotocaptans TaxID=142834 RepID=A0A7W4PF89_9PROT|nr:ABC transporter permease [Gluconacetobacter azotocaptans]GBQ29647.1 dipeptide/oligopeptide/nickel ABC transporter permease [Gluconacetobacter azotocaptans DSM 13594]